VEAHFRSEETLLTDWKHPLAEKQRCLHENLLSEATQLRDDTQRGKLPYQCFLDFFADEIVYKHIDLEDRNYFYEI
jgi:hemerythrin